MPAKTHARYQARADASAGCAAGAHGTPADPAILTPIVNRRTASCNKRISAIRRLCRRDSHVCHGRPSSFGMDALPSATVTNTGVAGAGRHGGRWPCAGRCASMPPEWVTLLRPPRVGEHPAANGDVGRNAGATEAVVRSDDWPSLWQHSRRRSNIPGVVERSPEGTRGRERNVIFFWSADRKVAYV